MNIPINAYVNKNQIHTMAPAAEHDTLLLHFKSIKEDGSIFEDSTTGEPTKIVLGAGMINPAFEEALIGKEPGDTIHITLPPEKAYGTYKKILVLTLKRKKLSLTKEPHVGDFLTVTIHNKRYNVIIKEITPTKIIVDGNHPLAGQTITYEITIVDNLGPET